MQIFKGDSESNSLRIMQMHSFRAEITCRRPSKALSQALNTGTNATKSTFFGNSSVLQIAWTSLYTSSIQALHGSVALPGPGGVKSPVSALPACSCHRTAPHPIKWLFRKTLRKWLKKKISALYDPSTTEEQDMSAVTGRHRMNGCDAQLVWHPHPHPHPHNVSSS